VIRRSSRPVLTPVVFSAFQSLPETFRTRTFELSLWGSTGGGASLSIADARRPSGSQLGSDGKIMFVPGRGRHCLGLLIIPSIALSSTALAQTRERSREPQDLGDSEVPARALRQHNAVPVADVPQP
jgi:hypothetical protein